MRQPLAFHMLQLRDPRRQKIADAIDRAKDGRLPSASNKEAATAARPGAENKDQPPIDLLSKEEIALGLLAKDSSLTAKEIAGRAGCHRTSLYRMPRFYEAWKVVRHSRAEARRRLPKGHRTVEGDLEAY